MPRELTLAEWRGDCRVAWWEHTSGERLMVRLDAGGLSQRMRRAPWGTPIRAYIHTTDFFLRYISGGERVAREYRHPNWHLPCEAAGEFWRASTKSRRSFRDKMLLRESGMEGDPEGAAFVLRLATGDEFPIRLSRSARSITVLPQCGARLGLVQEANRNYLVFLLRGK